MSYFFAFVDRRIGGLEIDISDVERKCRVDRRIGGLETMGAGKWRDWYVDRRIGGLEIPLRIVPALQIVDRRIGGLEMTFWPPLKRGVAVAIVQSLFNGLSK